MLMVPVEWSWWADSSVHHVETRSLRRERLGRHLLLGGRSAVLGVIRFVGVHHCCAHLLHH